MTSYFKQFAEREKPNRAARRAREQEMARHQRRATRAWKREQQTRRSTKKDED